MIRHLMVALLLAAATAMPQSAVAAGASLVQTGVVPNPLVVDLVIRPSAIATGRLAVARATVSNLGVADLAVVTVQLRVDEENLRPIGETIVTVGTLPGGRSSRVNWRLCGVTPGSHVVVAQAEADSTTLPLSYAAESEGRVVTVSASSSRAC